ncbi:MAG TPA: flagellar type III secretion system protein FlhA [Phycisphaerales bacterium]|nr:flagellar type III secretion system protein FlhA [Phycisphaerales bacterium]HIO53019.1 flagellar type III secretion system protein FlhA [Phycisphaerales bacterium]
MATENNRFDSLINEIIKRKHFLVPTFLLGLVAVLVIPLPPALLDIFLAANISLAAVILLTTVYTKSPLDFSVFPALLLITTLGRLVLNVASTRLILSADTPTPEQGDAIAGHVIEAFGTFVAGSNIVVGGIIFLILVVVQFVVVTKGATRMSEVAARFTLDAMPGRQMAIDADLSAGLIKEREATTRRDEVMREADFYGAMDGASKFVRGDAIAGLVIIIINIVGGLAVGIVMKGWSIVETAELFTRLTIGDGLVSQIPSFLIAIAAGLIVARAGNRTPLGIEIPKQLVSQPAAIGLVSAFLVAMSLTPLPTVPLLILAVVLALLSWSGYKQKEEEAQAEAEQEIAQAEKQSSQPISIDTTLELELGMALLPLASQNNSQNLVQKMSDLRGSIVHDLGIVIPSVRIKDNLALNANTYRLYLKGGVVAEGVVYKDRYMVVAGEDISDDLEGIREREPVFGYSAVWVTEEAMKDLGDLFVKAMDPVTVIMTHLSHVVKAHASELLSREDVSVLIEELRIKSPSLVSDVIGGELSVSRLHHIMKALLDEQVPLKDIATIVETAADYSELPLEVSVEQVRRALRRQICATVSTQGNNGKPVIRCVSLPQEIELALENKHPASEGLPAAVHHAALPLVAEGLPIVVVTSSESRSKFRKEVVNGFDDIVVLSRDEIVPEVELQIIGTVKASSTTNNS